MEKFTIEIDLMGERVEPCSIQAIPPKRNSESNTGWDKLVTRFHSDGVEPTEPELEKLFRMIAAVYDFNDKIETSETGEIVLSDEQGQFWVFKGVWPQSVSLGELIYTSDPSTNIDITWRFTECIPGHLE